MTSISGYPLIKTQCCGASCTTPRYASINLTAKEYWSDGHREAALYVEDGGLRKCVCGTFYFLRDASRPDTEPEPDAPPAQLVEPDALPLAIHSPNKAIELQARRLYWRHLNHCYREAYRAHMAAPLQSGNRPDAGSSPLARLGELVGRALRLRKTPLPPEPVSLPAYEPSAIQVQNMECLAELIQEGAYEVQGPDMAEVAELYRELGLFAQARRALACSSNVRTHQPVKLIADMIAKAQRAPFRYR